MGKRLCGSIESAPNADEVFDDRAEFFGMLQTGKREALAECDYRSWAFAADDCFESRGLRIHRGPEDYNRLGRELLQAQIAVLKAKQKRVRGDHASPIPDVVVILDTRTPNAVVQTSGTIMQAARDFQDEYHQDWKPRSNVVYGDVADQAVEILGPDTRLYTLDHVRMKAFRDGPNSGNLAKRKEPMVDA